MTPLYLVMAFPVAAVGVVILGMAIHKHRRVQKRRRQATAQANARVAEKVVRLNKKSAPPFCV